MSVDTPTAPPQPPVREDRIKLVAVLVAIGAGLLLGIGVLAVVRDDSGEAAGADQQEEAFGGVALPEARPRPDFTLTDTAGQAYDFRRETEGRLTLLFFGYTNCPDVCPLQMSTLAAALDQPGMPDPIVVFVTTDPDRDAPERLREWLDGHDRSFVGLTGTPEQIEAAEQAAEVAGSIRLPEEDGEDASDDEYLVGHAAEVVAYTPDDRAHVVYPTGVRRQNWMEGLPALMDEWGDRGGSS